MVFGDLLVDSYTNKGVRIITYFQIHSILTNKPNFPHFSPKNEDLMKNKPNSNPIKANLSQNKPNLSQFQSQTNPISFGP